MFIFMLILKKICFNIRHMHNVFINSLGVFLPNEPIPSSEMEDYIGLIHGKPSRNRALVLRQNKIKTRHYAMGRDGKAMYSSAEMAAHAGYSFGEFVRWMVEDASCSR